MATNTTVIDPNNVLGNTSLFNNIPVPLEDLTISVQLSVDKKSRTLLTQDKQGSFAKTEEGVSIKFIEGAQTGRDKNLTTNYTNLTTRLSDGNADEALGITSIDISFNSSYAPMIVIQFTDVRGSAIFQNESRTATGSNKYSVFFQLPYPLYKLSIKGYYGQQVEYCLHMTKMNSRFNSQTGNFEITANFVGYTYAMLSDALVGFMRAIPYVNEGNLKYKELKDEYPNLLTLDELYQKISEINNSVDGILSTSPQASDVNTGNKKLEELGVIKNNIGILNTELLNKLANKTPDNNDYSFTIYKKDDADSLLKNFSKYSADIGKAIDEYNTNTKFKLRREDFTNLIYIPTSLNKLNQNNGDERNKEILNYIERNGLTDTLGKDTELRIIDNRNNLNKISEISDATKDEISLLQQDLAKQLDSEITGKLNFSPSIRNIVNILTSSVEALFYAIYSVSKAAEENQDRKDVLKNIFKNDVNITDIKNNAIGQTPNNSASGSLSDKFYPWPAFRKKTQSYGYEESYLGDVDGLTETDKQKINELVFIDKLLKAFLISAEKIKETQSNLKENLKNWFAINPLDTRLFTNTEPYARYNSLSPDDIIRIAMLRAIVFLGVSNKGLDDEEIAKMADAEYQAIVRSAKNKDKTVKPLADKKFEDYINITGNYSITSSSSLSTQSYTKKLLEPIGSKYKYNFISFSELNNGFGQIIPINKGFNNSEWPDKTSELVDKRNEDYIFLTNYVSTIYDEGNRNLEKPDDGGIYVKIFSKNEYDEFTTASLPQSVDIKPLDYTKLKDGENPGFNIFGSSYGIQTFELLDYGINTTINGETQEITNFPYRYIFYSLDSSQAIDENDVGRKPVKANGLGYTRKDSGSKGLATTSSYDIYTWKNGGYTVKNKYEIISNSFDITYLNFGYFDYKSVNTHKSFGKNLELVYENSSNSRQISYPYIDFNVLQPDFLLGLDFTKIVPISLFGSRLYYEQTDEKAKAILFLHTFPWKGLVGEGTERDKSIFDMNEIIRSFNERAGFISVPKLWVCFIGGMLWRAQQTNDPIKFYKTNTNGDIIESFLPNFTSNYKNSYPSVKQYLLFEKPRLNQLGMLFAENGKYKNLDVALLNLPDQVKNEFISVFESFVNIDWPSIYNNLEIIDGSGSDLVSKYNFITNLNNGVITSSGDKHYANTEKIKSNFPKNFDNYIIFTPYYTAGNNNQNQYRNNLWLELRDDAAINQDLISLYKEEIFIANTNYRIWNNKPQSDDFLNRKDFDVDKKSLDTYIKILVNKFSGNTESVGLNEEEQLKQEIFGTVSDKLIKLQLYKLCKNIYDKWIGGVKNPGSIFFQCESTDSNTQQINLIDSFRFLDRAFKDIGDTLAVNPFPLMDYLTDNVNSSSYDLITSLLSSNNFNFVPLPNFINYRDQNSLDSIFKTFPTYDNFKNSTYGPTFICTYIGEASNSLDFTNSEYLNDGFDLSEDLTDAPEDFNSALGENDLPVTAFKVVYGQQNQNLFKDIVLDQSEFSETLESQQIMEDISQRGNPKYRTIGGQNMYNIWSVRSYKAEIEMMGNVMIQPMMYFQLDNIPMFHGAYMIIKVTHSIKPNHMSTNFTGVRIKRPKTTLFSTSDFYMSLLENIKQFNTTEGTTFGSQSSIGSWVVGDDTCGTYNVRGVKDLTTDTEVPTLTATKPIRDLVASVESGLAGYDAYNTGIAGVSGNMNYKPSIFTIKRIKELQALPENDVKRIFAVGKYQLIPETFKAMVTSLEFKDDDIFDAKKQEQAGIWLIIYGGNNRKGLRNYFSQNSTGKESDLQSAITDLALEFASMPTFFGPNKEIAIKKINPGGYLQKTSLYGGKAGNSASAKFCALDVAKALISTWKNLNPNKSPEIDYETIKANAKPPIV